MPRMPPNTAPWSPNRWPVRDPSDRDRDDPPVVVTAIAGMSSIRDVENAIV